MELEPYLDASRILVLDECQTLEELLQALAEAAAPAIPELEAGQVLERLINREQAAPTGTREGVAFPHIMHDDIDSTLVIVARVPKGIKFGEKNPTTCDLVFCMIGDSRKPWIHVRLLARMARIVHTDASRKRLRAAETSEDLLEALLEEDRSHG